MASRNKRKNSIPDRWEEYSPLGKPMKNTRFITFKVPLKQSLCHKLDESVEAFTPTDLLERCDKGDWSLGLVIDLTNTARYYNPQDFLDKDIEYQKIFTEGKVVPSPDVRKKFVAVVDDFIERHPEEDKLIGVHCTHGLNRTGYLVCRYMVDRLSIEADTAISTYNEARGYDMERENYLEDLRCGKKIPEKEYTEYRLSHPVKPYCAGDSVKHPNHAGNHSHPRPGAHGGDIGFNGEGDQWQSDYSRRNHRVHSGRHDPSHWDRRDDHSHWGESYDESRNPYSMHHHHHGPPPNRRDYNEHNGGFISRGQNRGGSHGYSRGRGNNRGSRGGYHTNRDQRRDYHSNRGGYGSYGYSHYGSSYGKGQEDYGQFGYSSTRGEYGTQTSGKKVTAATRRY